MKTIAKNIYELLFWGMFVTFIGLGAYIFGAAGEMVRLISAM